MYTQCPDCLTVYKVGPDAVAEGRGRLRCGHCGAVFDALATLTDRLPQEHFELLPARAPAGVPPVLQVPAMHPTRAEGQAERLPGEVLAAADLGDLPSLHAERSQFTAAEPRPVGRPPARQSEGQSGRQSGRPSAEGAARRTEPVLGASDAVGFSYTPGTPEQVRARLRRERAAALGAAPAAPGRPSPAWAFASVLLALSLSAQVLWVERERLYADPRLRGWLEQACGVLGCQVPLPDALDGLRLLARDVRPHEHLQGALVISGTLRNDAAVPIAFPVVEIRLADLNDRVIAMRRFRPEEYLVEAAARERGFPPQSSLPLLFEVTDPGQNALAFEFEFLPDQMRE